MNTKFVNIGFNNIVNMEKVIAVLNPDTSPTKRLVNDSRESHKLLDASHGRKTRAVIVMENGTVILCGLHTDTIAARLNLESMNKSDEDANE